MLLELDRHGGVPIYRQIMDQIRQQVLTGRLGQGDQLPSVRHLASRLKVNPMTVSKAYSLAEAEGLLERRRGIGLFVAAIPDEQKDLAGDRMLATVLRKAATTAARLGVSQTRATELFRKHYLELTGKTRRRR